MSRRTIGGTLAMLAALATAGDAQAQDGEWEPDTHRSAAGADMTLWSASQIGTITPVVGFANIGVSENFYIDAYLPFAVWVDGPRFAFAGGDGETRGGLGNPAIDFRYVDKAGIARWFVGGGAGIPLATIDDPDLVVTDLVALGAGAGYNAHWWLPDYLPLHVTGGVDLRVAEPISIQVVFDPLVFIDLDSGGGAGFGNDNVEHVLQGRIGLEGRAASGIGGGFWLKSVYLATFQNDNFQLALEPYFAYTGDVFFVRAGVLLALDEPYGFGFDDQKIFSGRLNMGAQF